ncbi:4285_t:CDS:2 [Paraglomus brasilianum]|uniref:3'-5' exonuclease n=1 Tax=Paraglomus brasilianum TaxID=144538 RepID=A0A9N9BKR4_9GLOM|nr:4285_t:CDS:2 [Paraglomus brasilianum]
MDYRITNQTSLTHSTRSSGASIVQELNKAKIPIIQTNPPVYQLSTRSSVAACFKILCQNPSWPTKYVGFDTETTVRRAIHRGLVSLIQIATREFCLIFQVYRITRGDAKKFPRSLMDFLADSRVLKVGVNARGDAEWLKRSYGIETSGIVDLDQMATDKGITATSLAELALMFADDGFGLDKTKDLLKWNFDAAHLNAELVKYASADAFAAIQIYENMLIGKRNSQYKSWEERNPMTREEEEAELYNTIKRQHKKGTVVKIEKLINAVTYGRWQKTKPDPLDRRRATIAAVNHYISDGRFVLEDFDVSAGPVASLSEEQLVNLSVKLPGVALDKLLLDVPDVDGFFGRKGLDHEGCNFIKKCSPSLHKSFRNKALIQLYKNSVSSETGEHQIMDVINKLKRCKALRPVGDSGSFEFNSEWLEELEVLARKEEQ